MVPERIRNVVLVGHGGAGKTSLAEALLNVAGATTRVGRVEDGTTVTDFDPEEIERQISLNVGVASCEWKGHKINILDAPGYADFVGDALAALRVADMAIFVVSAVDGVEVQTEALWRAATEEKIPRVVFINKLDRERSSFQRTLADLTATFGKRIAPIQLPIGSEQNLSGIVRVVSSRAFEYSGSAIASLIDLPDDLIDAVSQAHTTLIEAVVETDDEMMERYFEGEEPSRDQIISAVHAGMLEGEIFPVLCGSAGSSVGIDFLADFIVEFGPNPLEHAAPPMESGELVVSADGPATAFVFKTHSDPYVGRISLFRVFSGSVKVDDNLENATRSGSGRMHNLFFMQGKDHHDAKEIVTGDIAAVAKLDTVLAGDTLVTPGSGIRIKPVSFPKPVMSVAIFPRSAHDEDKLSGALQKVTEEDPTLAVERRPETHETVLSGLGDNHIDVTSARISRKFGVEIDTAVPTVPYRESITATVDAEGKHKKQSGGRGQFGVAFVKFAPLPHGTGFEFVNATKGGSVPRQFIPAVEKGVQEALLKGPLAGYPVVDVQATLYDGKYHSVDSDEMSFRMAGIMAFRAAAPKLGAVILEPIVEARIRVPEEFMGDVIGDINAKRGRVLGMDAEGHLRVVTAEAPLGEMQRYSVDLRSMTGGRGFFEMKFTRYEEMPHQEAQKVIDAARQDES